MKLAPTASAALLMFSLLGACDESSDDARDDDEEDNRPRRDASTDDDVIDWDDLNRDAGGGTADAGTADAGSDASTADAARDGGSTMPSGDGGMGALSQGGDCPEPSGPGTTHRDNVTGSETWTAADSPHFITTNLSVYGTLTIEACAKVVLSNGVSLAIGGSGIPGGKLITQGTYVPEQNGKPEVIKPVVFDSAKEGDYWGSLVVWYQGEAEFNVTALVHGGSTVGGYNGALAARGPNDGTLRRMLKANTLLILESAGFGLNLSSGAGFYENAEAAISVLGAGRKATPSGPYNPIYPAIVEPPGVGTLPPGEYYGSTEQELADNDRIYVYASRTINVSEQFHERGVPYTVDGQFYMRPNGAATLTIDPGVELRFRRDGNRVSGMLIGDGASIDPRPVKLDIQGTAEKPIVFTAESKTPVAGDWSGLYLDSSPPAGNKFTYAKVLYAGGESGTNSYGCGPKDNDAAILITDWRPDDAFLQNVEVSHSAGGGIMCGWRSDAAGPDLKTGNSFSNIGNGCAVSRWANVTGVACPNRTEEAPLCL